MKTYSKTILRRIRSKGRGWVFTPKDFLDIAPRNAISQVLFRLVKQAIIRRVSRGIYDFPIHHEKLGLLSADTTQIVKKIADKHDIICFDGAMVANQLGLDTQVPARETYLTSGQSKRKHIDNKLVQLKHSKTVSQFGKNLKVCNIILALQHLGKNYIDTRIIRKCSKLLSDKDKKILVKSIYDVPQWMIPVIKKMTQEKHERIS